MSTRAIWCVVGVWALGLVTGSELPGAALWLLLASGICGHFLPGVKRTGYRLSTLILIFLLAASAGSGLGVEITDNKHPHFRPLISVDGRGQGKERERDEVSANSPLTRRPEWASEPVWDLIQGVLFNRRDSVDRSWVAAFRSVGAAHLLAISGLHIGILMGIVFTTLSLFRLRRPVKVVLAAGALWGYVLSVGAPPSAVRAGLMISVGLALLGSRRIRSDGRVLPVAVLIALVVQPSLIGSVGFHLSVAAVTGIMIAISDVDMDRLQMRSGKARAFLRVSLGAQAGILPLQIIVFGSITPLAPLVNMVAVPLMAVWLPSAVVSLILGVVGGPLQMIAGAFCEGTGRILLWWIVMWDGIPGVQVHAPLWAGVAALMALAAWSAGSSGRFKWVSILLLGLVLWSPVIDRGLPRVVFLDVGQGDAIVIETIRPRRVVLVDAGPAFRQWSAGRDVIAPYLRSRGIRRIDMLVASHPDLDHIGGMSALLREFPVDMFMQREWPQRIAGTALSLRAFLEMGGIEMVMPASGDRIEIAEGTWLDILVGTPEGDRKAGHTRYLSSNNSSLVMRLNLGGSGILLTGDLERSGEVQLYPYWGYIRSDVLKVPHHGSGGGCSDELLTGVDPAVAVISVGEGNRHGHPADALLDRLTSRGIETHRTDLAGALILRPRR